MNATRTQWAKYDKAARNAHLASYRQKPFCNLPGLGNRSSEHDRQVEGHTGIAAGEQLDDCPDSRKALQEWQESQKSAAAKDDIENDKDFFLIRLEKGMHARHVKRSAGRMLGIAKIFAIDGDGHNLPRDKFPAILGALFVAISVRRSREPPCVRQ